MAQRHRELGVTACCGAVLLTGGYSLQAFAFSMPALVRDWAIDDALIGPLLACAMLGLMGGYLTIAPLADRFGARAIVTGSMGALALATIGSLFARDVVTLGAWRIAIGAASGGAIPAAVSIVSQQGETRWQGARVVAVYTAYSLGFLAAALVSGWLIPIAGWHAPWIVGMVLALGTALAASRLPPRSGRALQRHQKSVRTLFEGSRRLGTLLLWAMFPIGLSLFYTLQSWLPLLATRGGTSFSDAVAITGAFTLGNMIGALPMIWWSDRLGPLLALAVMGLVSLAGIALLALSLTVTPETLSAAALLAGIGIGGSQKGMTSAATLFYPPAIRATGLGWALGIGRIGAVAGPLLLGIGERTSWLPLVLPIPILILVLVPFWLDRRYGRIDRSGSPTY